MISRRLLAFSIAMLIAGGVAGAAHAEEFIFKVPLRFTSLHPAITSVFVSCSATDDRGNYVGGLRVEVPVDPKTGNLSQDLTLAFNSGGPKPASDAVMYKCDYQLKNNDKNDPPQFPNQSGAAATKSKPGTPFTNFITGPIPKGQIEQVIAPQPTRLSPTVAPILTPTKR